MSGSERPDSNRLIPVKALLQQTKAPHLPSWSALWNEIIRVFVFYSRMARSGMIAIHDPRATATAHAGSNPADDMGNPLEVDWRGRREVSSGRYLVSG